MLATGACGEMTTESAMTAATAKATLVKNPKTFWALTSVECMLREVDLLVMQFEAPRWLCSPARLE